MLEFCYDWCSFSYTSIASLYDEVSSKIIIFIHANDWYNSNDFFWKIQNEWKTTIISMPLR